MDKPFAAKEEQLLCTDCYSNEYSSKCQECKKTIMPGQNACLYHSHVALSQVSDGLWGGTLSCPETDTGVDTSVLGPEHRIC